MSDTETRPKPLTKAEQNRTPSARAKEWCRENALAWDWCESYSPALRRSKDFLGLFDLVYIDRHHRTIGVQVTGGGNGSARISKMKGDQSAGMSEKERESARTRRRNLWAWLMCGHKAVVWDFRKRTKGGVVVNVERVVYDLQPRDIQKP